MTLSEFCQLSDVERKNVLTRIEEGIKQLVYEVQDIRHHINKESKRLSLWREVHEHLKDALIHAP